MGLHEPRFTGTLRVGQLTKPAAKERSGLKWWPFQAPHHRDELHGRAAEHQP